MFTGWLIDHVKTLAILVVEETLSLAPVPVETLARVVHVARHEAVSLLRDIVLLLTVRHLVLAAMDVSVVEPGQGCWGRNIGHTIGLEHAIFRDWFCFGRALRDTQGYFEVGR